MDTKQELFEKIFSLTSEYYDKGISLEDIEDILSSSLCTFFQKKRDVKLSSAGNRLHNALFNLRSSFKELGADPLFAEIVLPEDDAFKLSEAMGNIEKTKKPEHPHYQDLTYTYPYNPDGPNIHKPEIVSIEYGLSIVARPKN